MRVAFMGTAAFAVPALELLVTAGHTVCAALTQPDRPGGRGLKVRPSPVKEASLRLELPLYQPDSLKSPEVRELFARLAPEMIVVVAYGRIIPPWLLDLPRYGVLNVHGSVLPKYRGAAPVNWAIARGEVRTGVSVMRMDEGLDTGPVYRCEDTAIGPDETAPELYARLAAMGARLLVRTVEAIAAGPVPLQPQDDAQATAAPRLRKEDGYIRWEETATAIHNKVRAFVPWPSVTVLFRDQACRILVSGRTEATRPGTPAGTIVFESNRLMAVCGDGRLLEIERLQLENRKPLSGKDFANGVRLRPDERFTAVELDGRTADGAGRSGSAGPGKGPDRTPIQID